MVRLLSRRDLTEDSSSKKSQSDAASTVHEEEGIKEDDIIDLDKGELDKDLFELLEDDEFFEAYFKFLDDEEFEKEEELEDLVSQFSSLR
jgi:hypothetical protein